MRADLELIFDGDCGLCRACVGWVSRRDESKRISCTPSSQCTWDDADSLSFLTTVVVRDNAGRTFLRSSAVARTLSALPGPWHYLGRLVLAVNLIAPFRLINDGCYTLIAKNRRAISNGLVRVGLLDASCRIPTSKQL